MMKIVHRVNTIESLRKVNPEYGVEVDLSGDSNGNVYMQHEPFESGELFEDFLKEYHHSFIILDIKKERIEFEVLRLIQKYGVKDFFFLDCSFPMIYMLTSKGIKDVAIRFSEFEGLDTVRNMSGKANWVWVDTFTKNPLTQRIVNEIKGLGYKICFVSPELQGQPEKIEQYLEEIKDYNLEAICAD